MNSPLPNPPAQAPVPALEVAAGVGEATASAAPVRAGVTLSRASVFMLVGLSVIALASTVLLWQKLSTIQEQLARQSADSGANAVEARAMARQAQEVARDTAARQAVLDQRLGEVALQRGQLEELMQSLSRSRDENLVVDIDSALRLAQQQAQLTGSAEPLLAALRTADQRLARAAQPRLARLRAAIVRDAERVRLASVTDVPGLLARLDDLVRQVDELPVANAVPRPAERTVAASGAVATGPAWWQSLVLAVRDEARGLLQVSRIDQPEAILLAPEQAFFLRENLKLKLLNARLGLLARQTDSARADLAAAASGLFKYFDPAARRTQQAATQLQQVQAQLRSAEMPRIDETLAVLATAAAGR